MVELAFTVFHKLFRDKLLQVYRHYRWEEEEEEEEEEEGYY